MRLSPSGYIVFSGDTAAELVVAFSTNDYVEPLEDSPFGALLSVANENALKSGAKSAVNANPANLLKSAAVASLASSASSASSDVADRRAAKWGERDGRNERDDPRRNFAPHGGLGKHKFAIAPGRALSLDHLEPEPALQRLRVHRPFRGQLRTTPTADAIPADAWQRPMHRS